MKGPVYQRLPSTGGDGGGVEPAACSCSRNRDHWHCVLAVLILMKLSLVFLWAGWFQSRTSGIPFSSETDNHNDSPPSCNTFSAGYNCFSKVSHLWAMHSPYFAVENMPNYSSAVPDDCRITFVQVLSRHGARFPTESRTKKYAELIAAIQQNATVLTGKYAFLKAYNYTLGAEQLTTFGERQMIDSGHKFYHRYANLTRDIVPFIRSSEKSRIVASGEKFIQGFQKAKADDYHAMQNQTHLKINVILAEGEGYNNTLSHSACPAFENNDSDISSRIKKHFTEVFTPPIRNRLQSDMGLTTLSNDDVIYLMDMCAFDTVAATPDASNLSPFCALFTPQEWTDYNYLGSLKKYYGYGGGNPLGAAQGIGYTNELIARLTKSPVHDHTSTNSTLDSNPATFPLNATLYADFGGDNGIVSALFALGLYNTTVTQPLSVDHRVSAAHEDGYSAAWSVPFAARVYFEMMTCASRPGVPLVRILVNDRVAKLGRCQADEMGRCTRDEFVGGLGFAREGGNWGRCYAHVSDTSATVGDDAFDDEED